MDSWERLACYPQGSFYPLSDGPSTRYHRITKPYFRTCSSCLTRSQAPFCLYTLRAISGRAEGTFGRLRYSFGGDRPSQTARLTLSRISLLSRLEFQYIKGGIPTSAPARLASSFPCLPPILYVMYQNPMSGYSKAPWGLSVQLYHMYQRLESGNKQPTKKERCIEKHVLFASFFFLSVIQWFVALIYFCFL